MPDDPADGPGLASLLLVVLILILVAVALSDVV
jgi:hypothetical protein